MPEACRKFIFELCDSLYSHVNEQHTILADLYIKNNRTTIARFATTDATRKDASHVHSQRRGQARIHPQESEQRRGHQVCAPGQILSR